MVTKVASDTTGQELACRLLTCSSATSATAVLPVFTKICQVVSIVFISRIKCSTVRVEIYWFTWSSSVSASTAGRTYAHKYCIIGAGASGLAVAKSLKAHNIPFDCIDREPDIGGLWNIETKTGVVYETTHLVSAAESTGWDDFPMFEDEYPHYPSHERVVEYFRDYIRHFGLKPHIELGRTVSLVAPRDDKMWDVQIEGEAAARTYRGVILANGHHNEPRMPSYKGLFDGEIIHSSGYKSPKQLRDKRVLVVGAGNSACDIARDAAHNSSTTVTMSFRRGYWFIPKFLLGFPTHDVAATIEMIPMPNFVRRIVFESSLWLLQGPPSRYNLPDPDYHIDQAHPTMSDDIPRLAAHGRIVISPEISHYEGRRVIFTDGTSGEFDMIVFATGYKIKFPFIDNALINDAHGRPKFFRHAFHPDYDNLFAAGLVQANGSIWRLASYQGTVMARFILAQSHEPERADWFRQKKSARAQGGVGAFVASDRHILETNYFTYRRALKRLIWGFGNKLSRMERAGPALPERPIVKSMSKFAKDTSAAPHRGNAVPAE